MITNPKRFHWQHDGQLTDGTPLDPEQFQAFVLYVNGAESFAVPLAWETDGTYEFPIADAELGDGTHTVTMTTRMKDGRESDPSGAVTFRIDRRSPKPPFGLGVAS